MDKKIVILTNEAAKVFTLCVSYLKFFLLFQHNIFNDGRPRHDEAEHDDERKLDLKDLDKHVVDVGRVRKTLQSDFDTVDSRIIVVDFGHYAQVCGALYCQKACIVVTCISNINTPVLHFTVHRKKINMTLNFNFALLNVFALNTQLVLNLVVLVLYLTILVEQLKDNLD
jgi:hypothetical protein